MPPPARWRREPILAGAKPAPGPGARSSGGVPWSLPERHRPAVPRENHLHLQQLDEGVAAIDDAIAFEQRLLLNSVEGQVLSQGVHELMVGNRGRDAHL